MPTSSPFFSPLLLLFLLLIPYASCAYTNQQTFTNPAANKGTQTNKDDHWFFGDAIDVRGVHAVVGDAHYNARRGRVYFWYFDGSTWSQVATIDSPNAQVNGDFGKSVALNGDAYAAVGAPSETVSSAARAGRVYFYRFNAAERTWEFDHVMTAASPAANREFGYCTDMSGERVVVGARHSGTGPGTLNILEYSSSTSQFSTRFGPFDGEMTGNVRLGSACAIQGNWAVGGAPSHNTVGSVVFLWRNPAQNSWGYYLPVTPGLESSSLVGFGISIDIDHTRDNSWIVVGTAAYGSSSTTMGNVLVFLVFDNGSIQHHSTFQSPAYGTSGNSFLEFGHGTSVVGDRVFIPAGGFDSRKGVIYQLEWSGSAWSQTGTVSPPTPTTGGYFGTRTRLSGEHALITQSERSASVSEVFFFSDSAFTPPNDPPTLETPFVSFEVAETDTNVQVATIRVNEGGAGDASTISLSPKSSNELDAATYLNIAAQTATSTYREFVITLISPIDYDVRSSDPKVIFEFTASYAGGIEAPEPQVLQLNITDVNEGGSNEPPVITFNANPVAFDDTAGTVNPFASIAVDDSAGPSTSFTVRVTIATTYAGLTVSDLVTFATDSLLTDTEGSTVWFTDSGSAATSTGDLATKLGNAQLTITPNVVPAGDVAQVQITLNITDGPDDPQSVQEVLTVNITSVNDDPAITTGTHTEGTVRDVADSTASATLFPAWSVSDADADPELFVSVKASYQDVSGSPRVLTLSLPAFGDGSQRDILLEAGSIDSFVSIAVDGSSQPVTLTPAEAIAQLTAISILPNEGALAAPLNVTWTVQVDDQVVASPIEVERIVRIVPENEAPTISDGGVSATLNLDDTADATFIFPSWSVDDADAGEAIDVEIVASISTSAAGTPVMAQVTIDSVTRDLVDGGAFATYLSVGTDLSLAAASMLLSGISIDPAANTLSAAATITFTVRVNDTSGESTTASRAVTISPVADAPTISTSQTESQVATYGDDSPAVTLFSSWTVGDVDAGATLDVSVKADFPTLSGTPVLAVIAIPGVGSIDLTPGGSLDASYVDITASPQDPATMTSALQAITIAPNANVISAAVTFNLTVRVDDSSAQPAVELTRQFRITPINDDPTIDGPVEIDLNDGAGEVSLFAGLSIADVDLDATVSLSINPTVPGGFPAIVTVKIPGTNGFQDRELTLNPNQFGSTKVPIVVDNSGAATQATPAEATAALQAITIDITPDVLEVDSTVQWSLESLDNAGGSTTKSYALNLAPAGTGLQITSGSQTTNEVRDVDDTAADVIMFPGWIVEDTTSASAVVSVYIRIRFETEPVPPNSTTLAQISFPEIADVADLRTVDLVSAGAFTAYVPIATKDGANVPLDTDTATLVLQNVRIDPLPNVFDSDVLMHVDVRLSDESDEVSLTRQLRIVTVNDAPTIDAPGADTSIDLLDTSTADSQIFPGWNVTDPDSTSFDIAIKVNLAASVPSGTNVATVTIPTYSTSAERTLNVGPSGDLGDFVSVAVDAQSDPLFVAQADVAALLDAITITPAENAVAVPTNLTFTVRATDDASAAGSSEVTRVVQITPVDDAPTLKLDDPSDDNLAVVPDESTGLSVFSGWTVEDVDAEPELVVSIRAQLQSATSESFGTLTLGDGRSYTIGGAVPDLADYTSIVQGSDSSIAASVATSVLNGASFVPVANVLETSNEVTFSVRVVDRAAQSESLDRVVRVEPVQNQPTIDQGGLVQHDSVLETATVISAADMLETAADVDPNTTLGVAVQVVPGTDDTWTYVQSSTNCSEEAEGNFVAIPSTATTANGDVLLVNADACFRFTVNSYDTVTAALRVRAWDKSAARAVGVHSLASLSAASSDSAVSSTTVEWEVEFAPAPQPLQAFLAAPALLGPRYNDTAIATWAGETASTISIDLPIAAAVPRPLYHSAEVFVDVPRTDVTLVIGSAAQAIIDSTDVSVTTVAHPTDDANTLRRRFAAAIPHAERLVEALQDLTLDVSNSASDLDTTFNVKVTLTVTNLDSQTAQRVADVSVKMSHLSVPVMADASLSSQDPTLNTGSSSTTLSVGAASEGFLFFPLPVFASEPPVAPVTLTKATLRLWNQVPTKTARHSVMAVAPPTGQTDAQLVTWMESTMKWADRPTTAVVPSTVTDAGLRWGVPSTAGSRAVYGPTGTNSDQSASLNQFASTSEYYPVSIDVTAQVAPLVASDVASQQLALRIYQQTGDKTAPFVYASSESTVGMPTLVLEVREGTDTGGGGAEFPVEASSAAFQDDGSKIDVTFATPTNAPKPCSVAALIDAASLAALGTTGLSCSWPTTQRLEISTGAGATIKVGDSLVLRGVGSPLASPSGSLSFAGATLELEAPAYTVPLSVSILATSQVGCNDLTATTSVSGLAGRPGTYSWSVSNVESSVELSSEYILPGWLFTRNSELASVEASELNLARDDLLDHSSFTLSVTVTNFLGASATAEKEISVGAIDAVIPSLVIDRQSASVPRSQLVALQGKLSVQAKCANATVSNSTSSFSFQWEHVSGSPITLDPTSSKTPRLVIPPLTLSVGIIYKFRLTATPTAQTAEDPVTADVLVSVTNSDLVAQIAGGDRITSWESETVLDASASSDPDSPTWGNSFEGYTGSDYTFTWGCRRRIGVIALECTDVVGLAAKLDTPTTNPILTIEPSALTPETAYSFSVVVEHAATARSSKGFAELVISEADVPEVSVSVASEFSAASPDEAEAAGTALVVVNGNNVVRLAGSATYEDAVDNPNLRLRYVWEETVVGLTLDSSTVKTGQDTANLVIREKALLPGEGEAWPTYTFRLNVHVDRVEGETVLQPSVAQGFAEVSVTLARPPSSGSIVVSPEQGTALETEFTVRMEGWTDTQQPLSYSFSYVQAVTGIEAEIILSPNSFTPSRAFKLPPGDFKVIGYVVNSVGAYTRIEFPTVVHAAANETLSALPECFASSLTDSLLEQAAGVGDTDQVVQLIQSLSLLLNNVTVNDTITSGSDSVGLTPEERACIGQASRETLLALRRALRLRFVELLASIAGTSGLDALRSEQISQALRALTGGDPDEVGGSSYEGVLSLISDLFDLSARDASGTATAEQQASLANSAATMVSVLANLLNGADCERYRAVATVLESLLSIAQTGSLAGESGSYGTQVFETEAQRAAANEATSVALDSGVDVQLSSEALTTDDDEAVDVLLTQFASLLWRCPGIAQRDPNALPINVTECQEERPDNGTALSGVVSISVRGGDGVELVVNDLPQGEEVEFLVPTFETTVDETDDVSGTGGRSVCASKRRANKLFSLSTKAEEQSELLLQDKCEWFDYKQCAWSDEGCRVVERGLQLEDGTPAIKCACTHLTEFMVLRRRHLAADPCSDVRELDRNSYALFGIVYVIVALYALRQLVRTVSYVKPAARKTPLGVHSLVLLVSAFRAAVCYIRYNEIDSLEDALLGVLVAVPTGALGWIFTFIILSWAGIAHFSMSHSTSSFEPLKKLFIVMNALVSLVVLGVFVPAFAVGDSSDAERELIRTGTYLMSVLMLLTAVGFAVYGMMLYSQLRSIQRDVKSSSDEKKGVSLALQILVVAAAFVVAFAAVAAMWLLSELEEDMYADNFTLFNSIYLGADVVCLCLALFLYGRVVDRAMVENSKKSRSSRTRNSVSSSTTATGATRSGSTRRGFRSKDGESRGSRRRLRGSARGSSQSSFSQGAGEDVELQRSRSKDDLVAAALARANSSTSLKEEGGQLQRSSSTASVGTVPEDRPMPLEQDPDLPPLPAELLETHTVPSHEAPKPRLSDASNLPPLPRQESGSVMSQPGRVSVENPMVAEEIVEERVGGGVGVGGAGVAAAGAGVAAAAAAGGGKKKGWNKVTDRNSGKTYYYNRTTQEMSWEKPDDFVDDEADGVEMVDVGGAAAASAPPRTLSDTTPEPTPMVTNRKSMARGVEEVKPVEPVVEERRDSVELPPPPPAPVGAATKARRRSSIPLPPPPGFDDDDEFY